MKPKLSIPDAIVLYLNENRGQWVPSYSLEKVTLMGKYTGISATRRMREVSALGYHMIKGVKYRVEQRLNKGMVEYRSIGGTKIETVPEFIEDEAGRVKVIIKKQEVLI